MLQLLINSDFSVNEKLDFSKNLTIQNKHKRYIIDNDIFPFFFLNFATLKLLQLSFDKNQVLL